MQMITCPECGSKLRIKPGSLKLFRDIKCARCQASISTSSLKAVDVPDDAPQPAPAPPPERRPPPPRRSQPSAKDKDTPEQPAAALTYPERPSNYVVEWERPEKLSLPKPGAPIPPPPPPLGSKVKPKGPEPSGKPAKAEAAKRTAPEGERSAAAPAPKEEPSGGTRLLAADARLLRIEARLDALEKAVDSLCSVLS